MIEHDTVAARSLPSIHLERVLRRFIFLLIILGDPHQHPHHPPGRQPGPPHAGRKSACHS